MHQWKYTKLQNQFLPHSLSNSLPFATLCIQTFLVLQVILV